MKQENDNQAIAESSPKTLTPIHSANLPSERLSNQVTKPPTSSKLSNQSVSEDIMYYKMVQDQPRGEGPVANEMIP